MFWASLLDDILVLGPLVVGSSCTGSPRFAPADPPDVPRLGAGVTGTQPHEARANVSPFPQGDFI